MVYCNMKEMRFEWDEWNVNKNEIKHSISALEAESAFFDQQNVVFKDIKHSKIEDRYILYGTSSQHQVLMIAFTLRNEKVRIISARKASKKERELYEKNKK